MAEPAARLPEQVAPTAVRPPTASKATVSVVASASAAVDSAKEAVSKVTSMFGSTSTASIIGGAIVAAIVAIVVAYSLYYLITTNITSRKSILLPESKIPLQGVSYTDVNASGIPASGNGKRMSMSFWIYINDLTAFRGLYRHVLHRGDKGISGASPLVYLDKDSNKLYIRFEMIPKGTQTLLSTMSTPYLKSTEVSAGSAIKYSTQKIPTTDATTFVAEDAIKLDLMARGISIDYIPIQRWVHVAVVVNEEINMGTISAYIDGEMVKLVSSDKTEPDLLVTTGATDPAKLPAPLHYNFQNLVLDKGGDVWVGGNPQDAAIGPGFDGLVSSIMFFNYDMNAKDVYDVYMRGPIDNVLAKMGLPAYGVRSPIFRIG